MNIRRDFSGAYKSIKKNFREYLCFLLALIFVQIFFGTVTVAYHNNQRVEKAAIEAQGYDYHAKLSGIGAADVNILNDAYEDGVNQDAVFFTFRLDGGNAFVTFTKDPHAALVLFRNDVLGQMNRGTDRVMLSTTPLYDLDAASGSDLTAFLLLLALLLVLSFLLLTVLFRIRINHFKFTYSIYMAFGGDFRKIFGSAFAEVVLLCLFSFPPALLLTYGVTALLYLPQGQPFAFYFLPLPVMLFGTLLASIPAIFLPVWTMTLMMPVKLMRAEDNSNLVLSPRRSAKILRKSAVRTELLALWRFRKYIVILLLSTVTFAALVNVGVYLANVYSVRSDTVEPDMTLAFASAENADDFVGYFNNRAEKYKISPYILEKAAVDPYENGDDIFLPHLAIPSGKAISGFAKLPANPAYSAAAALEIRPFDEDAFACFDSIYKYSYTGDPQRLLTDPSAIVVSSLLANAPGNKLQPGDKVYMPVGIYPPETVHELSSFDMTLAETVYVYREFTVAAVIDNFAHYSRMLVYLPVCTRDGEKSAYEDVMGQKPDYSQIKVYLSNEADTEQVTQFTQNYINNAGGVSFKLDYGVLHEQIREAKNYRGLILTLSVLVFSVSPLAGFFSQILFYKKRQLEYDVLRAVGGTYAELTKMFVTDGVVLCLLSGALYTGLSFLAVRILCALLNQPYIFALFGSADVASRFSPDVELLPFFIGLGLTLLFAAGEVFACGILCRRRSGDHVATGFAADDE